MTKSFCSLVTVINLAKNFGTHWEPYQPGTDSDKEAGPSTSPRLLNYRRRCSAIAMPPVKYRPSKSETERPPSLPPSESLPGPPGPPLHNNSLSSTHPTPSPSLSTLVLPRSPRLPPCPPLSLSPRFRAHGASTAAPPRVPLHPPALDRHPRTRSSALALAAAAGAPPRWNPAGRPARSGPSFQ